MSNSTSLLANEIMDRFRHDLEEIDADSEEIQQAEAAILQMIKEDEPSTLSPVLEPIIQPIIQPQNEPVIQIAVETEEKLQINKAKTEGKEPEMNKQNEELKSASIVAEEIVKTHETEIKKQITQKIEENKIEDKPVEKVEEKKPKENKAVKPKEEKKKETKKKGGFSCCAAPLPPGYD
ncbi:Hypothetical_protein [Hexamita inflata]|uniref:Hypothetical_protein n=1 Tax=Hexamita inflata TaxID=28002 RepID=A0AA86RBU7_9EUKA|nr:Hypothetical protein HINF_LOCUS62210 [Hexamita inflata]